MIITVKMKPDHRLVQFSRKLSLWSKPKEGDAEFTANTIVFLFWVFLGGWLLCAGVRFWITCLILGIVDILLRFLGIKSGIFWIPACIVLFALAGWAYFQI